MASGGEGVTSGDSAVVTSGGGEAAGPAGEGGGEEERERARLMLKATLSQRGILKRKVSFRGGRGFGLEAPSEDAGDADGAHAAWWSRVRGGGSGSENSDGAATEVTAVAEEDDEDDEDEDCSSSEGDDDDDDDYARSIMGARSDVGTLFTRGRKNESLSDRSDKGGRGKRKGAALDTLRAERYQRLRKLLVAAQMATLGMALRQRTNMIVAAALAVQGAVFGALTAG